MNILKNFIIKNRRFLLKITTAILIFIGLINFLFVFEITSRSNDECIWQPTGKGDTVRIIFYQVKNGGVTWNAGIRDEDELVSIGGEKIYDTRQAQLILNEYKSGEYADYEYKRGEIVYQTKVYIKKIIDFGNLGFSLLGFIWVLVAFIVVMAKSDGKIQLLFYTIGAAFTFIAMSSILVGGIVRNPVLDIQWLVYLVSFIRLLAAIFTPFLIINFFCHFPIQYNFTNNKYFKFYIYLIPSFLFVLSIIGILFFRDTFLWATPHINTIFYSGCIIGFLLLVIAYFKLKTKKERKSILPIIIGYLLGILGFIFTVLIANTIAENIFNEPEYFMPIILMAILPITFGYSIFRYSLMDVSEVVKRGLFYVTASILLGGLYFLIIFLFGSFISELIGTEYQNIIFIIIFILFALGFQKLKDNFQNFITQKFYPEQFAFQKVLIKFSNNIVTIVGLENILENTHNTFVDSLKLKHFGIALRNDEANEFELKYSQGFQNENLVLSNSESGIKKFLREKRNLKGLPVIERKDFEIIFPNDFNKLFNEEIYTIIPLVIKSKIIGLLFFGLKYSGTQFAGKDLELLIATANQTAASIENARLYETEADKLKIDKELEIARNIQESLLPKSLPELSNIDISGIMIPAQQVGGDYYDVIKISDTKVFIVIGDVSGKGLPASYYMTKLQTMIQIFTNTENSTKDILEKVNEKIYSNLNRNWFITISIALFDLEKGEVRFTRAGHTPLLICEKGKITQVRPDGIGVGIEKGEIFKKSILESNLEIKKGQIYVFFSDGVSEAMNENKDLFGTERLETILLDNCEKNASAIQQIILDEIKNFRGKAVQNDDIAIVVVKT